MSSAGGLNLVINAIDAINDTGTVYLDADVNPDCVKITVRDDGPGMSPDVLKKCTEPFFTTKGELGTGVGLSTVREPVHSTGVSLKSIARLGAVVR